jgi:L-fucono-1,5-lactonase
MIVDSHHHFWDPARADYPWMREERAPIRRRFGPEDLRPLLSETGVDATILVQTRASLQETREFLAVAAGTPFVAGVVGWADLAGGGVAGTLEELRAAPGGEKLVGIRHQVHDEEDAGWLLRPEVQRGLAAVGEAGLAYDLLVRARELPAALATARRFPEMRFVIDHLAKPPIAGGEREEWAQAMAPCSEAENVYCKLSGMVTEADWAGWTPDELRPYVESVLGWFGDDRCMFGSDWPVCLLAASYSEVFEALRFVLAGQRAATKEKVFGRVAAEFYRIAT